MGATAAITEASTVTIVVALMAFMGTVVASAFGYLSSRSSKAAAREVQVKSDDPDERTLAERIDARFDELERRLDRLEGGSPAGRED